MVDLAVRSELRLSHSYRGCSKRSNDPNAADGIRMLG
jgi:hypothetical protein